MENHPIPQDVTGFQFRLIGDMTVKQFAYLAAGVIMAWVFFSLPIHFLIKSPFVLFFAAMGASLAFVPIEGRPMDMMIYNFLKALLSPNQFVYQKTGGKLFPEHLAPVQPKTQKSASSSSQNLQSLLSSIPKAPKNTLDEKELAFLNSLSLSTPTVTPKPLAIQSIQKEPVKEKEPLPIKNVQTAAPIEVQKIQQQAPVVPQQLMSEQIKHQEEILEHEAEILKKQLDSVQKTVQQQAPSPTHPAITPAQIEALQKQLSDVLSQKNQLETQLAQLTQKMITKTKTVYTPGTTQQPQAMLPKKVASHIHQIPKNMAPKMGIPFTPDVPNLIAGIIKDARGNILPNMLIEVKDKEDNPVRAFKTNSLGQFASATPLVNGTYTISFEDPQGNHNFETIELATNGTLIAPLEVISIDAREELRRSLFGS